MNRILLLVIIGVAVVLFGCGGDEEPADPLGVNNSAPTVTGMNPSEVNPGQQEIEGRVFGGNFSNVTGVSLGDGIQVVNFSTISANEIFIYFNVSKDSPPGPRSVRVSTLSGVGEMPSVFSVSANRIPDAKIRISPPFGFLATEFKFDASGSSDDGRIVDYQWDFGDHRSATGKVVTHQFRSTGFYIVELAVKDDQNLKSKVSTTVDVDGSKPPIARFTVSPESGSTSTSFSFDGSGSTDPDGKIGKHSWSFGDGAFGYGETVEHQYASGGNKPVTLTVTDDTAEYNFHTSVVAVAGSGGGGDGQKCTQPARQRVAYLFRVLEADFASRTIIGEFFDDVTCGDVFYLCGDVRLGGYNGAPGKEYWIGTICAMENLGGNVFAIHLVQGTSWVDVGETETYVWPQGDCNPSIHCRAFGY